MLESLLPDALGGVSLGDNVLELGPGPGLTTLAWPAPLLGSPPSRSTRN